MKVLAKLGLVTAAAATILFIFIYEIQGPVINRVMSEPPPSVQPVAPINNVQDLTPEVEKVTELPKQVEEVPVEIEEVASEPVQEVESPEVESPEVETSEVESIKETITEKPAGPTRRLYGKITLAESGEQLGGVNIMVPGSAVAKVSNPNGGYTIEVPVNTRELVFIYRGKKLVKPINSGITLINVALDLESMQYD